LIKLGSIPASAAGPLEVNLNEPVTFLPAASALFHMTGKEEYFAYIQDEAEGDNILTAQEAAYALEPWPTRQCANPLCQRPLSFKDYWLTQRRRVFPNTRFPNAYLSWNKETTKLTCHACGASCKTQVASCGCRRAQSKGEH
jgi:hypothetical protein